MHVDTWTMRCEGCGATLITSDRWCDACDAPNIHGRFFPKFRSHLVDLELSGEFARTVTPPLEPGQRHCPRCEDVVEARQQWCPACGLDLGVTRPTEVHDPIHGVWRTPGPGNVDPYVPLGRLGAGFRLSLVLAASVFAVSAVLQLLWFLRIDPRLPSLAVDLPSITDWVIRLTVTAAGVSIFALVLAVGWTTRAYRNLPALGVSGLRFSADIVGAAWLVPGVNLVVPKLVIDELWRGSDPGTVSGSASWRRQAAPTIAHVGWLALLVGAPAAGLVGLVAADPAPTDDLRLRLLLGVAANLALLLAVICLSLVAGQIGERQDERALRLGPASILPLAQRRQLRERTAGATGASRPAAVHETDPEELDAPLRLRRITAGQPVWGRY